MGVRVLASCGVSPIFLAVPSVNRWSSRTEATDSFCVCVCVLRLDRDENRSFGLTYDLPTGKMFATLRTLRVSKVKPQGVVALAAERAGRTVGPGTRIIAVCRQRGSAHVLAASLSAAAESVEVIFRQRTPLEEVADTVHLEARKRGIMETEDPDLLPKIEFALRLCRGPHGSGRLGFSYDAAKDPVSAELPALRVASVSSSGILARAAKAAGRLVWPGTRIVAVNGWRGSLRQTLVRRGGSHFFAGIQALEPNRSSFPASPGRDYLGSVQWTSSGAKRVIVRHPRTPRGAPDLGEVGSGP